VNGRAFSAAILALALAPAPALAVRAINMQGSGSATFPYSPAANAPPPDGESSAGTVTVFEEGGSEPATKLTLKITGAPYPPFTGEDRVVDVPVTVTAAENAQAGCHVGSTGDIEVFATADPEINFTLLDCGFHDGYQPGHVGNQVVVHGTRDPVDAKPWTIHFDFDVRTEATEHAAPNHKMSIFSKMPDRYDRRDDRGIIEERTTPEEIDPHGGFGVELSFGPCPKRGLALSVDGAGRSLTAGERRTCKALVSMPEGDHQISVSGKGAHGVALRGQRTIRVQDWLVVGLGDSIGSGEGVPDLPIDAERSHATWQDGRCHRSEYGFEARTAQLLERHDENTSVTYLGLACSGAGIASGVIGGYGGIVNPGNLDDLQGQIQAAKDMVGSREVDAVIVSIGANDLQFGKVLLFCVKHGGCPDSEYADGMALRDWMPAQFAAGKPDYGALAQELLGLAPASRIYITQYPDPLREEDGQTFCDSVVNIGGLRAIRADEAQWTFENFLLPLNGAIQAAGHSYGWNVVRGAQQLFAPHGYCASAADRWMVQLTESHADQGDTNGTMHPNRRGALQLAKLVRKDLFADLYDQGVARKPGR
jgi:hypothetical protein